MSPYLFVFIVFSYFFLLLLISKISSDTNNNFNFFLAGKSSPWYLVAFGMIGASLSGITFISVPGWVGKTSFSYMQMVLGYWFGYIIIARILLPVYYKTNLTSIYEYLNSRFGKKTHKTGAYFFLLSRLIGASFRLYLVAMVFQYAIFDKLKLNVPFFITIAISILLIWLYTHKSGIKTIVWTDTFQTFFMLLAIIISIIIIIKQLNLNLIDTINVIKQSKYSKIFFINDWKDKKFFIKEFLSGIFIAVTMTGLDQDMMQKNLTCRTLKESQKNIFWFSNILIIVNFLFLSFGALLYIFAEQNNIPIPDKSDELYPVIALDGYLGTYGAVFFVLGLVAAAYSSADSALTSLTTSFCIDILNIKNFSELLQNKIRKKVHIFMSLILIIVIMIFKIINKESVINALFTAAGYTYGPLLGLYALGFFTKIKVKDKYVLLVCSISPIISFLLYYYSPFIFNGYKISYELLIINGIITFLGLLLIREKQKN